MKDKEKIVTKYLIKGLVLSKLNNEETTQLKTGIRLKEIVQRRYTGVR